MESSTTPNADGTKPPSSRLDIPIDPILLAWVPYESVPSAPTPAPTTDHPGSLVSPAAVVLPGQEFTLDYQRISSPAPAHGFPVVSVERERSILSVLSLPSALQLDMTIRPFAYLAAMPTAAEVAQICDVPESLYGRVKLEMYPIQVQRRAVMRMWLSFHWNWNTEADVKNVVSKELNKRFLQSKRSYEKKMAKLATRDVANATGLAATTLPDAQAALAVTINSHPDAAAATAFPFHSASSGISAACTPATSEPTPDFSSGSSGSSSSGALSNPADPGAAWSDPDFGSATAFLADARCRLRHSG
ncbi:hypothetical protein FPQ18DRAFT_306845 [Pyronema domesticum]|nr:hypothetical protein FPQ18DRAFT_306845 [Pyronema domesticum]